MPKRASISGSELFIVDNSDQDWKVQRYLHDWCQISKAIDIATGYFEIGSLLSLNGEWKKVDKIRILMGDEVSRHTKKAFEHGLRLVTGRLDSSLESEKEKNDFLQGVPAIVDAIRSGKIECRVYRKEKFHAKAYITHARLEVVGASALVGSSNFTFPGLMENIELNVQITGGPVTVLQEWYEEHWNQAEDVTPEILHTIDRHIREYLPFDVYIKSLHEFFRGHSVTAREWEETVSQMYPILDQYQKDGYHAVLDIANNYGGSFLCDGVGLGKTFVGLMLLERFVMYDRKRVALLVPKSARTDVWERDLRRYLPHIGGTRGGDFSSLAIFNHTDLGREGDFPYRFERIKEMADVILIDEAHHFRNPGIMGKDEKRPSRYRQLFDLMGGDNSKQLFMLTATPVNNTLHDLRHMIELFSRGQEDYFRNTLGIHSLRGHFITMERHLRQTVTGNDTVTSDTNIVEAGQVLTGDNLFRSLVVQRSRVHVKRSQALYGGNLAMFPEREPPKVVTYSVRKTYGRLLDKLEKSFAKEKPLFALGIYYPLAYYKGSDESIDALAENRQKQVVSLIRTQFLKRFESSAEAFALSCHRLFLKLLTWATKHSITEREKTRLQRWREQHSELIAYVMQRQNELGDVSEDEVEEDVITEEMLATVDELSREEYDVQSILADTFLDLDQIAEFLNELRKFSAKADDKLKALIKLLKTDPVLKQYKALIFTEFAETARYLKKELQLAGIEGVDEIDSGTKANRSTILCRFAPYYNGCSTRELAEAGDKEIRILLSTDVLSEGLNLQDATRLINYDIHWNPVRLMQRIGRVDRRMNPGIEAQLILDHPDQKELRGKVAYWNFLPPEDLDTLLALYKRVSHKTLLISKTFGIEGKKLLHPDDNFEALKDFNHQYEGEESPIEEMRSEYQRLFKENPELADRVETFPGRLFSGREHISSGTRAVFFCYRIPRPDKDTLDENDVPAWTDRAGETRWYLYVVDSGKILEEAPAMMVLIQSDPETPRHCIMEQLTLTEIRVKIEKHIKNTYLKRLQAPIGVKPILKAWMELN